MIQLRSVLAGIFLSFLALGILVPGALPQFFGVFAYALNLLDTIAHELGHIVFGYLGRFIGVLGGSIGQLTPPLLVLGSALRNRIPIAAASAIFWLGQNFVHMSPYIADARNLKLEYFQWWAAFGGPVLEKGDPKHHDWNIILSTVHLLWADRIISLISFGFGVLLMLAAILFLICPEQMRLALALRFTPERLRRSVSGRGAQEASS